MHSRFQRSFLYFNFMFSFCRHLKTWLNMPSPMQSRRCVEAGIVNRNGRKSIVVAGGFTNSSKLFDFETMTWKRTSDLPFRIFSGSALPYKDGLVIIAGHYSKLATSAKSILYYDAVLDKWEVLEEELKVARCHFTAFFVPDQFC